MDQLKSCQGGPFEKGGVVPVDDFREWSRIERKAMRDWNR